MSSTGENPAFDVHALVAMPRVSGFALSPDRAWIAVAAQVLDADAGRYRSALWRVPLDGGAPRQLTRGRFNDRAPAFRRDGSLAFLSNRPPGPEDPDHDDTIAQIWLLPAEGGEPVPFTDEPLGVSAFAFATRTDRLVVEAPIDEAVSFDELRRTARERAKKGPSALRYDRMPVRHWDHWVSPEVPHLVTYDGGGARAEGRRDLTPEAGRAYLECGWHLADDGRLLVATEARPAADRLDEHALRLFDLEAGTSRLLGAGERVELAQPRISPDGSQVVAVREVRAAGVCSNPTLHLFDLSEPSGQGRPLAAGWDAWPEAPRWTAAGEVVVTAPLRGDVPVFAVTPASDGAEDTVRALVTDAGSFADVALIEPTATLPLLALRSRLTRPPEVVRITSAGVEPLPIAADTVAAEAHLEGLAGIAKIERFAVSSDDGVPVETILLTPRDAPGPHPTLLWIHGGPMSAWGDGWHWRWNPLVFVARGYAVAMPNPRGSTGYGQAFVQGIWGNTWGGQCARDLHAVSDALEARPDLDPTRIAAMGGSFGGYMSNWLGATTDRYRCLVTHASIYSMSQFYGTTDYPAWRTHSMGMTPYDGRDRYDLFSPERRVADWRTPTLIIHGERDYRVPIGEALALFEGLQLHGVPSDLLVFPDEGHWIQRPRNIVTWYDEVRAFLDRHLQETPR